VAWKYFQLRLFLCVCLSVWALNLKKASTCKIILVRR